jgi:predicted permease
LGGVLIGAMLEHAPAERPGRVVGLGSPFAGSQIGARVAGGGALRRALIAASVALAMVMLVSATLVGRSFVRLMRTNLGFTAEHVLAASIVLPEEQYDYERAAGFFEQLIPRLAAIPGVRAAGAVNLAPFSGGNTGMDFVPGTHAPTNPSDYRSAAWRAITPGYFATLGIPLVRGRVFDARDVYPSPNAIIINASMARIGWPGADPIGTQVTLANGRTMTVVGVVGDTRAIAIDSAATPTMYFAHGQFPWKAMWLTVRTTGDPMTALAAVEREVHALDPNIPLARAQPLTRLVDDVAAEPRLTMLVFGIFATAALVLAAVGLYGLVSYTVAQRTREIGVRLALGAAPAQVARAVVRDGLLLAAIGVAVGAVISFGAGRALRAILYETEPTDAITFVAVALVLVMTAMLASLAPARRASKLEPVAALRAE